MSYKTEVYRIVRDYKELEKFVNSLPDLGENYKYYISLFARKKYGGTVGLTSDKCQLKRCVATKDRIIQKLKQMEIPLGAYTFQGKQGEEEVVVGQQSLVVYISANPRDMYKAAGAAAKKTVANTVDVLSKILSLDGKDINEVKLKNILKELKGNPQAEALSQIQVHGKKIWFNVDIDVVEGQTLSEQGLMEWLLTVINIDACKIIKTRGGYHVLVNLNSISKQFKSYWYNNFVLGLTHDERLERDKIFTVDMKNGDGMLPIPGCVQSEFTPKVV